MSEAANTPRVARTTWTSPFQFEPCRGGEGVFMDATDTSGTSSRRELVGDGLTIRVKVGRGGDACLALGGADIEATTDFMELEAGVTECFTLRQEDNITHAAVITRYGATTVQITRGYGG